MHPEATAPRWMSRTLLVAAFYNILWGGFVVLAPNVAFAWIGLEPPRYPEIWQCLGMVVGVYGVGYALAARAPYRYWPLVLVGLLGKLLGPVGFAWAAARGRLPWEAGWTILTNDLVWWIPFALILRGAAREHRSATRPPVLPLDLALSLYHDRAQVDLLQGSRERPLFLIFLRHFGCTFCREALSDLRAIRDWLAETDSRLVLVHMSSDAEARSFFAGYDLDDATQVSDPDRVLYRAFALRRGSPAQLFGWSVWKRGWEAGVKEGHGVGWLRGDGAQMPGAFMVWRGRIVGQFIHETAADRPDYVALAEEGADCVDFQSELDEAGVGFNFQDRIRQALQRATPSES